MVVTECEEAVKSDMDTIVVLPLVASTAVAAMDHKTGGLTEEGQVGKPFQAEADLAIIEKVRNRKGQSTGTVSTFPQ